MRRQPQPTGKTLAAPCTCRQVNEKIKRDLDKLQELVGMKEDGKKGAKDMETDGMKGAGKSLP